MVQNSKLISEALKGYCELQPVRLKIKLAAMKIKLSSCRLPRFSKRHPVSSAGIAAKTQPSARLLKIYF
jgi:hypothetical protein